MCIRLALTISGRGEDRREQVSREGWGWREAADRLSVCLRTH